MVDGILADCEDIGASLREAIASWTPGETKGKGKQMDGLLSSGTPSSNSPAIGQVMDGAISLLSLEAVKTNAAKNFISSQPSSLSEGTVLKGYQLLGVNWLNLLYRRNLSCILADEMGMFFRFAVIHIFIFAIRTGKNNSSYKFFCSPQGEWESWSTPCRGSVSAWPGLSLHVFLT